MELEEKLQAKQTTRKCPFCGELLPPLSKVCPSCGQIVENSEDETDVTSLMEEIDGLCTKYANLAIRIYDYILLLIPIVYLIWVIVVIMKIIKSNRTYNTFMVLRSKAQTMYGDNLKFRSYLSGKVKEMESLKQGNKIPHIIIYVILAIDIFLLCISLSS